MDTRQKFLDTCDALMNPPFNCGQPIVDQGFLYNFFKLITSPTFFIFGCVFIIVGILYALKSVGGLGGKSKKNRTDRTGYTIIPDDTTSRLVHDEHTRAHIINDSDASRSMPSDNTHNDNVEMIVDQVFMSDESRWSENDQSISSTNVNSA